MKSEVNWDSWDTYQDQLRREVNTAIDIWKDLLEENDAVIAYAKGSAIKKWEDPIDYVPVISDLDIHVDFGKYMKSLELKTSLDMGLEYEQRFYKRISDAIHLPRLQIMNIRKLQQLPDMVDPSVDQVQVLIGSPQFEEKSEDQIRKIDQRKLEELKEIYDNLPETMIDRTGKDRWIGLRRITWQVSPLPARILTQYEKPNKVWKWNRSKLVDKLHEHGLDTTASLYLDYYHQAWELFTNNFQSTERYYHCIHAAAKLFKDIIDNY